MSRHKRLSAFSSAKGFTLLEVALAVIIGGMLLGMFGEQLIHMLHESKVKTTQYRLEEVSKAVNRFLTYNNHYPCPADRTLQMENTLYGYAAGTSPSDPIRSGGTCADVAALAGTVRNGGVRIGMVPTRTLNLPDEFGYDGWGTRLIYAVTENLTNGTRFRMDQVCSPGGATGGPCIEIGGNPQRAAYLLASTGPDRQGGYNIYGQEVSTCGATPNKADNENCDDDAVFTDMPHSSANHSGGTDYNDDMIAFTARDATSDGIPVGAIMPFRMVDCPKGWDKVKELEGRILVDSGTYSGTTSPLSGAVPSNFARGAQGGSPTRNGVYVDPTQSNMTSVTEYQNFPPFVSYTYCVKN